ncbi:hypothetical protein A4X13_0g512, partial [Tilletia indica]
MPFGKPMVERRLDAKLHLTILTRNESKPDLQRCKTYGATLTAVDYDSVGFIAAALEGIGASVSVLGNQHKEALPIDLAKATKKADVKIYVPSEFGTPSLYSSSRVLGSLVPILSRTREDSRQAGGILNHRWG